MNLINNVVGLFVGQSSKKRQIGIGAGVILSFLWITGVIDNETYKFGMYVVGFWTGAAFSAKLSKMAKDLKR